jgi:hypothetical protein
MIDLLSLCIGIIAGTNITAIAISFLIYYTEKIKENEKVISPLQR